VTEGGDIVFTISLVTKNDNSIVIQSASPIDITFSTVNGTDTTDQYTEATAPYDYNSVSITNSIPPFNSTSQLTITSLEDNIFELDELFTLNGIITSNNTINTEVKGIGTIIDNDSPPSITMNNSIENEGVDLVHTITISHPSSTLIQIEVITSDDTAISPDDYTAVSQSFSIDGTVDPTNANTQTTPFQIPTLIDNINEANQEFLNVIGTVTSNNVGVQDLIKTGTIIDINPYPIIYADDETVVEGNPLVFTIRLLNSDLEPLQNYLPIDLEIETLNETARASEDYQRVFTTISIPAFSTTTTTQEVVTIDDLLNESTETMLLKATDISPFSLAITLATGYIKDNDFPNLFSPNSDGRSDVFKISGIEDFLNFKLLIIDRWGSEVYNYSNNGRTNPIWWDGTYNGKPVIEGVYFYTLDFNDGITAPKRSFIQLIR
jgi:gliding motility-associated-like protein